jgi:hypothetical protein
LVGVSGWLAIKRQQSGTYDSRRDLFNGRRMSVSLPTNTIPDSDTFLKSGFQELTIDFSNFLDHCRVSINYRGVDLYSCSVQPIDER